MTWLVEAVPDAAAFLERIAPWRWRDPRGAHAVVGMALGEAGRPGSTIEWFVIGESVLRKPRLPRRETSGPPALCSCESQVRRAFE